mmetsp:Transcript_36720/g.56217  ORF Transcript_36720/g.56217 Transcript_36720/m.56217 type:complete len:142 (+) Transcript_36720:535-960(+)
MPLLKLLYANDTIECCTLTRIAKLKIPDGATANGNGGNLLPKVSDRTNLTSPPSSSPSPGIFTIQKSAIAFRYIGKTAHKYRTGTKGSSDKAFSKSPFELTLEYGPQRTCATFGAESTTIISTEYGLSPYQFLSWENEGKV